ncbi:ABC transporter ATP-binding protein [Spiroplasma endosymbiont of Aspidapion aeneum]|uniref:ABC transporter ATP-binding protein n=1 Tax=Spiroplasma endosymbiont of Aspidapion aeneum TaxID=3066276 RepID=UPI00313B11FA
MKINLHKHTLKIKQGEKDTRNLDISNPKEVEKFVSDLEEANVMILAITNHNYFDLNQFNFLEKKLKEKNILLLPGVELDILDEKDKIHNLNVIVSNEKKEEWNILLSSLINNVVPEEYRLKITDFKKKFKDFVKICLMPNKQKGKFDLAEHEYELLSDHKSINFYETSNLTSTQILAIQGVPAINGSDDLDTNKPNYAKLPDIRNRIDTFENLIHFFKKDPTFMTKYIREKHYGDFDIKPYGWANNYMIPIYKDVNVIIGPRGSGKTELLKAIKDKIIKDNGEIIKLWEDSKSNYIKMIDSLNNKLKIEEDITHYFDDINKLIEGEDIPQTVNIFNNYKKIINYYKEHKKSDKYHKWQIFTINKIETTPPIEYNAELDRYLTKIEALKKSLKIIEDYEKDKEFPDFLTTKSYIFRIIKKLINELKNLCKEYRGPRFIKSISSSIKKIIEDNTSNPTMPDSLDLCHNYLFLKSNSEKILKLIGLNKIKSNVIKIGSIRPNLQLSIFNEFCINPNPDEAKWQIKAEKFSKTALKFLGEIADNWKDKLFYLKMRELKKLMQDSKIDQLRFDNLIWKRSKIIDQNGKDHNPSTGEEVLLTLTNYLDTEREFYFLDEPDKSLDNYFTNDEIVTRINSLAKNNKVIVLTTHNANIAVRTWPYSVIYRELGEESSENETYIGSPFLEYFQKNDGTQTKYKWKEIAVEILEGGKDAFHERGDLYETIKQKD